MQDQGKRLLLAVALALGMLLLWNQFSHKDEPPRSPPGQGQTAGSSGAGPSSGSSVASVSRWLTPIGSRDGGPAEAPARPIPPVTEPAIDLVYPHFAATFTSDCGGLSSWKLTDKRYERDATKGELLPARWQMTVRGADGKPAPAPAAQLANLPACGTFDVNFAAGSTYFVPRHAVWKGEKRSPTEVRYTFSNDQIEVVKDFTLVPQDYLVRMAVRVTLHVPQGTEAHQQLAVTAYAYQDPEELKNGSSRVAARAWSSATLRDDTILTTDVSGVLEAPRFEPPSGHAGSVVHWTGFDHPYLLAGYASAGGEAITKQTWASDGTQGRPKGFMETNILYPPMTVRSGEAAIARTVVGYLGPKNYDDLNQADTAAGFSTGFDKVIDLGWFAFIGRPLLWLLQRFEEFAGNWGISIILLTIVVKLLTLYWTTKSMRSMKQMAALAPQMKVLQTKYADDKQRQQAETMALYKQHGVNPVAGCLPILLQMPVWLALYRMLANAGELYQQPFIPGWISDLTATDPYYILPAVLFITMFLQARLQPATADSTQQKFLQYGMPIMFGVMAFFFPAGLTLYMLTNNVLSALHSIYMNRFDRQSLAIAAQLKKNQEAAAAAAATAAKPGGPGSSGQASRKAGGQVAKRVIDAKATEVVTGDPGDDGAGDGDDTDDAAGSGAVAPGTAAARNRPRRKKRRR
jgi:YidC/Oxa1 family membrane protein insertase